MEKIKKSVPLAMLGAVLSIFLIVGTADALFNGYDPVNHPGCYDAVNNVTYECGDTIPAGTRCSLNGDMICSGDQDAHGLIIGGDGVTIDGNKGDGTVYVLDGGGDKICQAGEGLGPSGIFNQLYDNLTVKNLEIKRFCNGIYMKGIPTDKVENNLITGCEIHDNGDESVSGSRNAGIWQEKVYNSTIRGCKIYSNTSNPEATGPPGGHGIYLCSGDNNFWHQNVIYENRKAGMFFRCSPVGTTISSNYVHDNGFGGIRGQCINVQSHVIEDNCCLYNNNGAGIFVGGDDTNANTVRNNICNYNQGSQPGWKAGNGIRWDREAYLGNQFNNTACYNEQEDVWIMDYANIQGSGNTCNTEHCGSGATCPGCDFACEEKPDLKVTWKQEYWLEDGRYLVRYMVTNCGTDNVTVNTTICLTIDGNMEGTDSCPPLGINESYEGEFGPFVCTGGEDVIMVCADCPDCPDCTGNGDVEESNEENNCLSNEWTCELQLDSPDLVIIEKSEEWIDPNDISKGYKVNYTVKNQGTAAAGESTICLFIDDMVNSVASQVCPALDPGNTYSGTFEGPFYCDEGSDTVRICADWGESCDGNGVVEESDEENNCRENEWTCAALTFDIRNGAGEPGDTDRRVEVSLKNDVAVAGIQVNICNAGDYLYLPNADDVELTDRAAGFTCDFQDDYPQAGCARLVLYSTSGDVIAAGDGPIFILHYDVEAGATAHSCVEITSDNLLITDEDDEPLTAAEDPGSFFFGIYGDPWPYDDVNGTVGDGEINIFDVVRDVQISLETYTPTYCEFVAGDVPTGFGTDCQAPDEDIKVSDVLEMVAKILGRPNCIDSY